MHHVPGLVRVDKFVATCIRAGGRPSGLRHCVMHEAHHEIFFDLLKHKLVMLRDALVAALMLLVYSETSLRCTARRPDRDVRLIAALYLTTELSRLRILAMAVAR